ncbi:MAG: PopZ family protein, partial [Notoacmeibacter sp.]
IVIAPVQASSSIAPAFEIEAQAVVVPAVVFPAVETPMQTLQGEMARLVSQSPERRVAAAFDDLNAAFVNAKQLPVENMAETMLRPMLKDWLDNNLPNLVERLVREEISRIARGDI